MIHKNNMLWYTWNTYRDNYIANYRNMSTWTSTNVIISIANIETPQPGFSLNSGRVSSNA